MKVRLEPALYAKQAAAIFDPARYVVIEASTKSGKTLGCLQWLISKAGEGGAGQNFWWVAPVYSQADIAFRRARAGLAGVARAHFNSTALTIRLPNGAIMRFLGSDNPDSLYGDDVFAAVVDEASRCREEAWHALRSTLTATRGPVRIIGNVKGRKNWFYRLARRAEAGETGWAYHRLVAADAVDAGVLAAEEVEEACRDLPEQVFRELYLAEPSTDAGNPFGEEAIRLCIGTMSDAEPVVWGWDLAKSVDWTVGIALDANGTVCRFERFQRQWQTTIETILNESCHTRALIDSTGVGDPILEALQKRGGTSYEGFRFSAASKQQLMEGLAVAIQQGRIRYPPGLIPAELEAFEYVYTRTGVRYSAAEGMHDDCVCALALAVQGAGSSRGPLRVEEILTPSMLPGAEPVEDIMNMVF